MERKNSRHRAEAVGDASPHGHQRILRRADRDADSVRDDLRDQVVATISSERIRVDYKQVRVDTIAPVLPAHAGKSLRSHRLRRANASTMGVRHVRIPVRQQVHLRAYCFDGRSDESREHAFNRCKFNTVSAPEELVRVQAAAQTQQKCKMPSGLNPPTLSEVRRLLIRAMQETPAG